MYPSVEGLVLRRPDGVHLLGPLDLHLEPGARVALVGESGSGKSLLAQSLSGALPPGIATSFRHLNAGNLGYLPQAAGQALHPLLTLEEHLGLLPSLHRGERPARARARLAPLLARLDLPSESAFLRRFPHELSGGQRQRLALAMALSWDPSWLVLDEPTASLDATRAEALVDLILDLHCSRGLGFLWITHDLVMARRVSTRVQVLYGGYPMEAGPTTRTLESPRHPYTARLLAAARSQAPSEGGFLPAPGDRPEGCPFAPRCDRAQTRCAAWSPWRGEVGDGLRCEAPLAQEALGV